MKPKNWYVGSLYSPNQFLARRITNDTELKQNNYTQMIPAQELRLNNLVVLSETKEIQVVQGFHLNEVQTNDIGRSGGDHDFTIDDIEPIELTPEMLIKNCGFIKGLDGQDGYSFYQHTNPFFELSINGQSGEFQEDNYGVTVQHLHQLQNLFFSLTGEELIVNF